MSQKDESQDMAGAMRAQAASGGKASQPPPELGKEIAKQLKQLYAKQVAEPLPDRFTLLLEQLAKAEPKE